MRIVAATQNKHKIDEIQTIMGEFGMAVVSQAEAGLPDIDVEEDGDTFEANSEKKAREIMRLCGEITVADDSGLMVDALGGAPGVISARFAGEHGNDGKNNEKLLALLEGTCAGRPHRPLCFGDHDGVPGRPKNCLQEGNARGILYTSREAHAAFGYDPLIRPERL